jgi:hypothetical protein
MDMFGGLTKTSSRIAIAAALGMTLGGFVMSSHPAKAADLGGDCCADLEERVAELEATTVRKGNKKVSVTLSGWVVKDINWWDDGKESNVYVGDKGTTLSSHFQISGSATIAPGWSGGYTMSIEAPGTEFGFGSNQQVPGDDSGVQHIDTLLSYMWIKSDKWGTVNWGELSQATDNVALLPDLSGTIIESNAVFFEGNGFFLRPKGAKPSALGQSPGVWGTFLFCDTAKAGIGMDCNGVPYNAVRYDSPTYWGFNVSTSYGEDDIWDVALRYAADWNNFKVSAAIGYSQSTDERYLGGGGGLAGFDQNVALTQGGVSILHVPTGLFWYGAAQTESIGGSQLPGTGKPFGVSSAASDSTAWFMKGGIKRTWLPLGATVLWGEGGVYNDMFADVANTNVCGVGGAFNGGGGFTPGTPTGIAPVCAANFGDSILVNGSEVDRWGVGLVQEIDAAAMHVFARWQHQELDVNLTDVTTDNKVKQNFENWDLFQLGGVIFF